MNRLKAIACLVIFAAGTAAAHNGVKNAAVMARMNGMSAIVNEMKTLGSMASGKTGFDAEEARAAAAKIASHAAETPALFEMQENDPKSEARPSIWTNFDDFTAKSKMLEDAALDLSKSIKTSADIAMGLAVIGETCKSCHALYRE